MAEDRDPDAADENVVPLRDEGRHPSEYPTEEVGEPDSGEAGEQFDLDFSWLGEPESEPEADAEDLSAEEYSRASTRDYDDLAKLVEEADASGSTPQAVSVVMPGLDHGVVGFEDVTGEAEPEEGEEPELFTRVATAAALVAVFVVALFIPEPTAFAALVFLVSLAALAEFYGTVRASGFNPMVLIGLLGSAAMLAGAWFAGTEGPYAAAGFTAGTVAVLALWYVLTGMHRPLENGALTLLGVLWVPLMLSFAMPITNSPDYRPLILFVVVVTATMDISAYFIGRGLGRTRLAPALSPSKTVEGLVGGAVVALGVGAGLTLFSYFDVLELTEAIGLAAVILVFAPLGDLTESLAKRSLGVKDMGSILPGHGGLLDRIDGLIFVVPAAYYAMVWMGILQ